MTTLAILLPHPYRGGTLESLKSLARMFQHGSVLRGRELRIVVCPPAGAYDVGREFASLLEAGIAVRPCRWQRVSARQARAAWRRHGRGNFPDRHADYALPLEGDGPLLEADFWFVVSDRVGWPLLPLRPYGAMVFDYIQRYAHEGFTDEEFAVQARAWNPFVREARFVAVTTPGTANDLNSYVGVPRGRIVQVPMFLPQTPRPDDSRPIPEDYFLWVTNSNPHKNQHRVLQALESYYAAGGALETVMAGPYTHSFRPDTLDPTTDASPAVLAIRRTIRKSPALRQHLHIAGELSAADYASAIRHARFLLHAVLYDNGTFSVIDAARLGTAALSSRYPAMEFINERFRLNLAFFDPFNPADLAAALRRMETDAGTTRAALPDPAFFYRFDWKSLAGEFIDALAGHLEAPA